MKMLQWCIIEEDDLAIMGYRGNIMQTFVFSFRAANLDISFSFPASYAPKHIYRQVKNIYQCKQFAGGELYRLLAYKYEVDWSNSYA